MPIARAMSAKFKAFSQNLWHPMSPILSLFWGPLCEIRDPHRTRTRGYSTAFKLFLSKGSSDHSELTSYKNFFKNVIEI